MLSVCVGEGGGGRRRMEKPATLTPGNNDALGPAIPRETQRSTCYFSRNQNSRLIRPNVINSKRCM